MTKKRYLVFFVGILFLGFCLPLFTQFKEEEVAERERWEEFLRDAEIVESDQPFPAREAVTRPWKLTLEKDGITKNAIWKNPQGRMKGYMENWKWEIAAYRLDKYLGLCMVPPTVEKRFKGDKGSCQLWVDYKMSLKHKNENKVKTPSYKVFYWNRALFLQRAFDNLIANEDRHQGNYLITDDWRIILIDHSRSFRTSKEFTEELIFTSNHRDGNMIMRQLPRSFIDRIKTLDYDLLKELVGQYLTSKEIKSVLARKDLVLDEVDRIIGAYGQEDVLY